MAPHKHDAFKYNYWSNYWVLNFVGNDIAENQTEGCTLEECVHVPPYLVGFLYAAGFGAQSRISIYLDDVMKLSTSEVSSKHKNLFLSIAEANKLDG